MADNVRSEDSHGQKWDRCISDTMIKFTSGLGLGIVFSVMFFRRRPWPVAFGAGVGVGMGYGNCQHDFQQQQTLQGQKIKMCVPEWQCRVEGDFQNLWWPERRRGEIFKARYELPTDTPIFLQQGTAHNVRSLQWRNLLYSPSTARSNGEMTALCWSYLKDWQRCFHDRSPISTVHLRMTAITLNLKCFDLSNVHFTH